MHGRIFYNKKCHYFVTSGVILYKKTDENQDYCIGMRKKEENMSAMLKVKNMIRKGIMAVTASVGTAMMYTTNVFAAEEGKKVAEEGKKVAEEVKKVAEDTKPNPFLEIADPIVKLIENLFAPTMAIVVAAGTLYCIVLGVKFAKAEEPQEHEKAKTHLKNAIIGFVLIFVLVVALRLSVGPLTTWMNSQ